MKKTTSILILMLAATGGFGQVSILFPELHFGTDLQDVDKSQRWIGLFNDPQRQYYLQNLELTFEKVADPMIDEEGEYSGIRIITGPGIPHYIFSDPELFHPGKVKNYVIRESAILPGDTLVIRFLDREYKLTAKGTMQALSSGKLLVGDYGIYITTWKCSNPLIGESEFFDGNMFEIMWSADLNGDGEDDFICTTVSDFVKTDWWLNSEMEIVKEQCHYDAYYKFWFIQLDEDPELETYNAWGYPE